MQTTRRGVIAGTDSAALTSTARSQADEETMADLILSNGRITTLQPAVPSPADARVGPTPRSPT